ncbi:hypothetical protein [Methanomethylophilus alvi]|uniref:hypothetical protein n=1 Tax=Methanomethylophilus alvi TaxID=1291540 RepID=UPI0037DCE3D4
MEYKALTCPYCGAKIPPNHTGTSFTCEYCGNLIVLNQNNGNDMPTDPNKSTLTIEYEASGYVVIPDMHVTITKNTQTKTEKVLFGKSGKKTGDSIERSIPVHRKLKLSLDKGEYSIFFKSSIRKNTTNVNLDRDVYLRVGWNRVMGKIVVDTVENPDELI